MQPQCDMTGDYMTSQIIVTPVMLLLYPGMYHALVP